MQEANPKRPAHICRLKWHFFFLFRFLKFTCGRRQLQSGQWSSHWSTQRCSPRHASGDPRSGSWEGSPQSAQGSSATPGRQSSPTSSGVKRSDAAATLFRNIDLFFLQVNAVFINNACAHTHTDLTGQQDRVLVQTQHCFSLYGNVRQEPTGGLREKYSCRSELQEAVCCRSVLTKIMRSESGDHVTVNHVERLR